MYINPISNYYAYNNSNRSKFSTKNNKRTVPVSFKSKPPFDYEKCLNEMVVRLTNRYYGCRGVGEHAPAGYIEAIKRFNNISKVGNISEYITLDGESAVFQLDNGKIFKISCEDYYPYIPKFHAPEVTRGKIITDNKYPILFRTINARMNETNEFYYLIQQKGQLGVSQNEIDEFIKMAEDDGYSTQDIRAEQFAYFDINGKKEVKLVDMGCLYKKNDGSGNDY